MSYRLGRALGAPSGGIIATAALVPVTIVRGAVGIAPTIARAVVPGAIARRAGERVALLIGLALLGLIAWAGVDALNYGMPEVRAQQIYEMSCSRYLVDRSAYASGPAVVFRDGIHRARVERGEIHVIEHDGSIAGRLRADALRTTPCRAVGNPSSRRILAVLEQGGQITQIGTISPTLRDYARAGLLATAVLLIVGALTGTRGGRLLTVWGALIAGSGYALYASGAAPLWWLFAPTIALGASVMLAAWLDLPRHAPLPADGAALLAMPLLAGLVALTSVLAWITVLLTPLAGLTTAAAAGLAAALLFGGEQPADLDMQLDGIIVAGASVIAALSLTLTIYTLVQIRRRGLRGAVLGLLGALGIEPPVPAERTDTVRVRGSQAVAADAGAVDEVRDHD